jgi:hypothetical protein
MIRTESTQKLCEKLELAKRQLKNARTREEIMAISNYIYLLDDSIGLVSPTNIVNPDKLDYLDDKTNGIMDKKYFTHEGKMIRNYLSQKDFHEKFFERLSKKTEHIMHQIEEDEYSGTTSLTEEEYYNIFFEFMNKIGLAKYFDKYVRGKRIYTTSTSFEENTLGYTLFNPITKDSDIFIGDLEYDIFSMFTLAHEFGHIYDLNHFNDGVENYNEYFYQSFNGEAVSKTFERLFVDFLIEHNILVDEAKDQMFDMVNYNYEYLLSAYIISLIPDIMLIDGSYLKMSPTKLYKLVERFFNKKNHVRKFINKCSNFELKETYMYAYGDVYSLFLKDRIKQDDYSLNALNEFFEFRSEIFNPDMLERLRIDPKGYVKLYKKDIELLKK